MQTFASGEALLRARLQSDSPRALMAEQAAVPFRTYASAACAFITAQADAQDAGKPLDVDGIKHTLQTLQALGNRALRVIKQLVAESA